MMRDELSAASISVSTRAPDLVGVYTTFKGIVAAVGVWVHGAVLKKCEVGDARAHGVCCVLHVVHHWLQEHKVANAQAAQGEQKDQHVPCLQQPWLPELYLAGWLRWCKPPALGGQWLMA